MAFVDPANDAALVSSVVREQLDKAAPTGIMNDYVGVTAPTGWVLAAGKTIGDATSGGTERANADTTYLFTLLWNSFSNTDLPIQDSAGVASTRGLSAAADFAAHKRMPVPDLRGRVSAGLDNLGGTSANRIVATEADTIGKATGTETHTLITAEIPSHTHTLRSTAGTGNASLNATNVSLATASAGGNYGKASTATQDLEASSITSTGGDGAHNNTQPTIFVTKIIKL